MPKKIEKEPDDSSCEFLEMCVKCGRDTRTWWNNMPLCYPCSRKCNSDELPTFEEYVRFCQSNDEVFDKNKFRI